MIGPLLDDGEAVPGVINPTLPSGAQPGITATWQLNNDGSTTISPSVTTPWVNPANATVAAFYQVQVDATSGTFTTGTTGTWLDLDTSRTWTKDTGSVTFTVSIREKASSIVRTTQTGLTLAVV